MAQQPHTRQLGWLLIVLLSELCLLDAVDAKSKRPQGQLATTAVDHPQRSSALKQCCQSSGMSEFCVEKLCNIDNAPNEFEVFDVATSCPNQLPAAAKCLADGRNHMPCCRNIARGTDEECLGFCDASVQPLNVSNWDAYKQFVACLSFNINSMYDCIKTGQETSPGPPRILKPALISSSFVELIWSMPKINPRKVKRYRIAYSVAGADSDSSIAQFKHTTRANYILNGLTPDTKYVISVVSEGEAQFESLPSSNITIVTKGISPSVRAYRDDITIAADAEFTLVCFIDLKGTEHADNLQLSWSKATSPHENSFYAAETLAPVIPGKGLQTSSYAVSGRRSFVMSLRVERAKTDAFGTYRCNAKNAFGKASVDILVKRRVELSLPPQTPSNLTQCCVDEEVQADCLAACRGEIRRPMDVSARLSAEISVRQECAADMPKVLKCSTQGFDQGACCLRMRVPQTCLSFCDGTMQLPLPFSLYECLTHTDAFFQCQLESRRSLPEPPRNIRVASQATSGDDSERLSPRFLVDVQWDRVNASDSQNVAYYLYARRRRPSLAAWQRHSVSQADSVSAVTLFRLSVNTDSAYELLMLTANSAGVSSNSRSIRFSISSSGAVSMLEEDAAVTGSSTTQSKKRTGSVIEQDWAV